MNVYDIELVQTSIACPEQYDAIDCVTKQEIGYLRLRHGRFTVEVPGPGGRLVYESHPAGDGIFEEAERTGELNRAIEAIAAAY